MKGSMKETNLEMILGFREFTGTDQGVIQDTHYSEFDVVPLINPGLFKVVEIRDVDLVENTG